VIKIVPKTLGILFLAVIAATNLALIKTYFSPINRSEDVKKQLSYLKTEIHDKQLAERMQQLFPEGYIFTNALYGLAWCEHAISEKIDSEITN